MSRRKKTKKGGDQLPDLDHILDALSDASAMVEVVYLAFQTNGRDGPEQSVLCRAITDLAVVHEQLDIAGSQLWRVRRAQKGKS